MHKLTKRWRTWRDIKSMHFNWDGVSNVITTVEFRDFGDLLAPPSRRTSEKRSKRSAGAIPKPRKSLITSTRSKRSEKSTRKIRVKKKPTDPRRRAR